MNRRRFRLLTAALALFAGVVVLFLATELFPYHTINHDEAVYLQQAAMLLDGQLALRPPVPEAFRPWFFVRDGAALYPKYSPVPAAMFSVGELVGGFRLALAAVAAGNVALTAAVVAEAFDRRTGLLAGAFLLASPLFLLDSSAFLPYAPTTVWNLLFALAYIRSARLGSDPDASARSARAYALFAGLAVGVAFFARPFTAVLFAAPFVGHAVYSVWIGRSHSRPVRSRLARLSPTALGGLAGVAVALGYNAVVTDSPLVFPYEAFAPRDGLGFGHREMLDYSRNYTPELALRANAEVVEMLFTKWVVAGPLGTLLAAVGVGAFLFRTDFERRPEFTDAQAKAILAGLFVSVVAGNIYFWGNLNILGSLADPADGLIDTLGPYYHFDLLVPTAAFAAHGALLGFDRVRGRVADRSDRPNHSRRLATLFAVAGLLVLVGATAGVLGPTVSENAAITDEYERAYQPVEDRDLSNAVVFLPTPYGDWLNHPFQHLRNDPGFDGEMVYATSGGPSDLAVVSAYPNRSYYRYVYRGTWAPSLGESVNPALRRVEVARGDSVAVDAAVGVPDHADRISMRLATSEDTAYYGVNGTPANLSVGLRVGNGTAALAGPKVEPVGENASARVVPADEVVVQIFVSDGAGGFSYRLELPVRHENGSVVALSPTREVCLVARNCNGEAAYVEGSMPDGVQMETTLRSNGTAEEDRDVAFRVRSSVFSYGTAVLD